MLKVDLKNCAKCGKVYLPMSGLPLCPDCAKSGREEFDKVRTYLKENPHADIMAVSEATGVSRAKILEYLREGRLTLVSSHSGELTCERCDQPIVTGRFCDKCMSEIRRRSGVVTGGTGSGSSVVATSRFASDGSRVMRDRTRRR